jgi:hypothetical protein
MIEMFSALLVNFHIQLIVVFLFFFSSFTIAAFYLKKHLRLFQLLILIVFCPLLITFIFLVFLIYTVAYLH